jgi:hypothetical protein
MNNMCYNYLCSRNKAILILIENLESFFEFLLRISILERRKKKTQLSLFDYTNYTWNKVEPKGLLLPETRRSSRARKHPQAEK